MPYSFTSYEKMYVDYQLISIMFSHYILNIRKYKCMHITYSTLIGTLIDRWLYNWYRLVYFLLFFKIKEEGKLPIMDFLFYKDNLHNCVIKGLEGRTLSLISL